MGLDQYLRAKTTKRVYNGPTGACNGLFPVAPADKGMVEIGYWRNAYDQEFIIYDYTSSTYTDAMELPITKEEVDKIISVAKEILATHTFDKEYGYDITEESDFYYSTFNSENKWQDTIKFFEEAKKILEEDSEAEIYYCSWR